jgi:hypothetical protein
MLQNVCSLELYCKVVRGFSLVGITNHTCNVEFQKCGGKSGKLTHAVVGMLM